MSSASDGVSQQQSVDSTGDPGLEIEQKSKTRLPAEEGIWVFIVGDMLIFSAFFLVFMYYRSQDTATFIESQATLSQNLGAINTLLLLTSSWFVALALHCIRNNWADKAARLVAMAGVCGAGFVVVKYFEYSDKINAGYLLNTNDFYTYYYIFTGIHLFHLLIGLVVLRFLWTKIRTAKANGQFSEGDIQTFESGAAFWHLVDLLWIVLFALIYLLR